MLKHFFLMFRIIQYINITEYQSAKYYLHKNNVYLFSIEEYQNTIDSFNSIYTTH